jgi:hypothetical protein
LALSRRLRRIRCCLRQEADSGRDLTRRRREHSRSAEL